jgi:hypothetical protein
MIRHYHQGPFLQRGRGIGSVLSALFSNITPVLKGLGRRAVNSGLVRNLGNTLVDSAVKGGLNFATDALSGGNLKESATTNLAAAKRELAKTIKRSIRTRRRPAAKRPATAKRARNVFDAGTDSGESDNGGGGSSR